MKTKFCAVVIGLLWSPLLLAQQTTVFESFKVMGKLINSYNMRGTAPDIKANNILQIKQIVENLEPFVNAMSKQQNETFLEAKKLINDWNSQAKSLYNEKDLSSTCANYLEYPNSHRAYYSLWIL